MSAAAIGLPALWGAIVVGAASCAPRLREVVARRLLGLSALLAAASTVALAVALVVGDFSIDYVVDTTSRATPWPYRLSALWGGMDGSMLFYAALTLAVGWWAARRAPMGRPAMAVIAVAGVGYLLVAALVADPFETLDIPAVDGAGLPAILQHPAMTLHPPILYLGLTALAVPAALTVEAALRGEVDRSRVGRVVGWLLPSWVLLTVGMAAGAAWAYVELGWGGLWAWDPVENAALMPWLAATAFLHTSRARRGRLRRWNTFAATVPFTLTILGAYLTRSGVVGSIHSFAESPAVGRILLTATAVAVAASIALARRVPRGEAWERAGPGRDMWLLVGGAVSTALVALVLIGSAYPVYAHLALGKRIIVGPGYFAAVAYPFALATAIAAPFASRARRKGAGRLRLAVAAYFLGAALAGVAVASLAPNPGPASTVLLAHALAAVGALAWDIGRARPRGRRLAGRLAHLGAAMILAGAAGGAMGDEHTAVMSPGDSVEVGGRVVAMLGVDAGEAERYVFARARLELGDGTVLTPEVRAYEDQATPVSEPALHTGPSVDVIAAVSRVLPDGDGAEVSVFVRPMTWWVWAGALTAALAGLLLIDAPLAGGASKRRQQATAKRRPTGTTSEKTAS